MPDYENESDNTEPLPPNDLPCSCENQSVETQHSDYPIHAFGKYGDSIKSTAHHLQVDHAMPGSMLLVETAALAQPFLNVATSASGKSMPVSLYMLIIAESGERKSSTIDVLMDDVRGVLRQADDSRHMMLFNDPSIDGAIVSLIKRCPSQFLLAPEGASLLGSHAMNKDSLSRFAGTMASLYSAEPLSRIRVNEHIYAEGRRLSILISAQPSISIGFLSNPIVMEQGLGNRFLYCWPKSRMGKRKLMRTALKDLPEYQQLVDRLKELAAHPWEIDERTGGVNPRTIYLNDDAWVLYEDLFEVIEGELGPGGEFTSHKGYVNRFLEQVLRISALLAVLDDPEATVISAEVMARAIDLGNYYFDTALNIFRVEKWLRLSEQFYPKR